MASSFPSSSPSSFIKKEAETSPHQKEDQLPDAQLPASNLNLNLVKANLANTISSTSSTRHDYDHTHDLDFKMRNSDGSETIFSWISYGKFQHEEIMKKFTDHLTYAIKESYGVRYHNRQNPKCYRCGCESSLTTVPKVARAQGALVKVHTNQIIHCCSNRHCINHQMVHIPSVLVQSPLLNGGHPMRLRLIFDDCDSHDDVESSSAASSQPRSLFGAANINASMKERESSKDLDYLHYVMSNYTQDRRYRSSSISTVSWFQALLTAIIQLHVDKYNNQTLTDQCEKGKDLLSASASAHQVTVEDGLVEDGLPPWENECKGSYYGWLLTSSFDLMSKLQLDKLIVAHSDCAKSCSFPSLSSSSISSDFNRMKQDFLDIVERFTSLINMELTASKIKDKNNLVFNWCYFIYSLSFFNLQKKKKEIQGSTIREESKIKFKEFTPVKEDFTNWLYNLNGSIIIDHFNSIFDSLEGLTQEKKKGKECTFRGSV